MNELISIVIPTKNEEKRLKVLLPSLVKQTYKNFEVIINDDIGTNDGTKMVIKIFQKKLKIKHIYENKSMAEGRKNGAKHAKGKYQLHLDADMKLAPNVLEECIMEINKGFDALVIPEVSYGEGFWSEVKAFERSMYVGDETMESARFVKTSVYKKVGGHNEKMVFSEDKDFDLRIRKQGYKVGRINEPIFHDEGKLSFKKDLQKKIFLRQDRAFVYIRKSRARL